MTQFDQADPSLVQLHQVLSFATKHLESRKGEINDLNVFPVADGDTGDNMALTLNAVMQELEAILVENSGSSAEIDREAIVTRLAQSALMGARGNSGVILSQLIRGASEELTSRPGELIRAPLVAAAFAGAARRGYQSVKQPVEGTMLTVAREMAGAASHAIASLSADELSQKPDSSSQFASLASVIMQALEAGQRALDEGPELLPVLKEAGVVDAGGFGLLIFFAGIVKALVPELSDEFDIRTYDAAVITQADHASETFQFCTNFAVTGAALDDKQARGKLGDLGDSIIVVVGDVGTLKVHVHTDDPEAAMGIFAPEGEISNVDVADMREQVARRAGRSSGAFDPAALNAELVGKQSGKTSVVAVYSGAGFAQTFHSLGAYVVDGGDSMNPSTAELMQAIEQTNGSEIVLLPNNKNVFMAANEAAKLTDKPVKVVEIDSPQVSAVALLDFDSSEDFESVAESVSCAADGLIAAGVAPAAKNDPQGRFSAGDALGYVNGELTSWGSVEKVVQDLALWFEDNCELLTLFAGSNAPLSADQIDQLAGSQLELEHRVGGQTAWWWLIAGE